MNGRQPSQQTAPLCLKAIQGYTLYEVFKQIFSIINKIKQMNGSKALILTGK
jgi:hypothetical protein